MKLKKFYSLFLILTALLCSGSVWGEDQTLTVMDDDWYKQDVPVDGYNLDGTQHNQFLLLSSELSAMNGSNIKGLKFYFDRTGHSWNNSSIPTVVFRLKEVENTSLSSQIAVDASFTQVYSGTIDFDFTNKVWSVTFSDPYSYNGGNLLIDIQTTPNNSNYVRKSGYNAMRYYTAQISGRAMKGSTAYDYCPKTTFTYEEAPAGTCAKPTAVTATQNTPVKATLSWTKAEGKDNYQYLYVTKGTDPDWTGVTAQNTNSVELDGLTAGTEYDFYVRTYCSGDDQSDAVKKTFSTSCPAPTAPQVTNIATTTATLSWTAAAGISDYQYIVVERGAAEDWTSPTLVEGAITTPLSGLTAGTKYDVYVRSYYSATAVSTSIKGQFQTPCNAMSIADFNGTFESETAGSGLMPNCWEAAASYDYSDYYSSTTTTYPCVKETYSSNTGNKCLAFYGGTNATKNIAVLPVFTEVLNTLTVSFYYKNYNTYSGQFSFGYYKNGVFTAYEGAANLERKTTYTYFEMVVPNVAEAEGARLAIQYAGGSYSYDAYIDDVTVILTPSCTKPSGVTVSNIVYDGATIDWTENGSATAWKVQYSTDNTNWETENVTSHPYDLRGLTTGTPYYVQVISVCGGSDESPAVAAASTFTPTCVKPGTPTIPAKTTTTATIQWTVNSGEDEWYLQYKKASDAEWSDAIHVTTNPTYTLTGLEEGTTYRVHVTAGCKEDYTAAAEFDTECEAKGLPYNWGFDALNCWTMENCVSGTGLSGNTFMFKYGYANQYLISPELDTDDKQVTVEFDYHKATSGTETFMVGYSTTTNAVSAFTFGDVITATNTSDLKYSEILPAGAKYIAIAYTSYDQYYFYVDNFSVTEYVAPSCAAPTALAVSEIGTNSAKVTWESEAGEYALEYKKTSDEDWTAATGTITSPFALEGLTANETEYTVRMKAICGVGNESEWVVLALPFKTDCEIPNVTELASWSTDFEDQITGNVPSCWSVPAANTNYEYAKIDDSHAKDGSKCLDVKVNSNYSKIILLPEFAVEAKYLNIAFDYNNGSTSTNYGPLEVGYYSGSTFTNVATLTRVENYTASGVIEMPKTTTDGARIAFRVVGSKQGSSYNSHSYIDNVVVTRKPACAVPTITAATATSDGAVVAWTPGDEESAWNLRYSVKDANVWTVVEDVTTGYAITGLTVGTTYEVQVQANCGGSQSAWTASANFTPVCNAPSALAVTARTANSATFSWTSAESAWVLQYSTDGENWESENVVTNPFTLTGLAAGQTYQAKIQAACGSEFSNIVNFTTWCAATSVLPLNEDFENIAVNALPACWEKISDGEYPGVVSGSAAYGGDGKCVCFFGVGTQILVLPAISAELADYKLSFFYKNNSASLELGYINNAGEFELLQTLENQTAYSDEAYTYALTNSLMNKNLAFRYVGTSAMSSHAYLDVVRISKAVVLADNVNNTATLAALNGQTLDVVIGRTITRTGYFNTICLPFDMPTLVGTPLEGAELWAFKYAKVENEELLFRIVEASSIEAGVPYFIQFAAGDAIVNPLFKNVTIAASAGQKVGDENMAQLCGILQPEIFTPGDQTKLFLYNENALYWWNGTSASALNSFRAYFKVVTTGADAPARHNMPARLIKEEQQATGMESVQPSVISSQKILENGQVIIIRNGVKYSVQGQVIR